ncbi:MAG: hypothetical protein FJX74_19550 [Armatimonadetes bacterium]|nr:hypothetical protein [Armatimonadota bacterium]
MPPWARRDDTSRAVPGDRAVRACGSGLPAAAVGVAGDTGPLAGRRAARGRRPRGALRHRPGTVRAPRDAGPLRPAPPPAAGAPGAGGIGAACGGAR